VTRASIVRRIAQRWSFASPRHDGVHEEGFTLLELAIAMLLGAIVLSLVLISVSGVFSQGVNGTTLGQANDNANLALDAIQRDVLSADVIFPATTTTAMAGKNSTGSSITTGFAVRMLTYTTQPDMCVEWRVLKTGTLERRWWPTGQSTSHKAHGWVPVVSGVKNTTHSTGPLDQKVFTLNTTTTYGGRLLTINLILKASAGSTGTAKTVNVQASYPSRNAEFFSSTDTQFCTPVPST
jgi:prepilin-type N-terminal cleavage/methylation domain-containing protein